MTSIRNEIESIKNKQEFEENGISGLILAAGCSSRMGAFKPLLPLKGSTIIEKSVDSLMLAGAHRIVVVTGYRAAEVESLLRERYGDQLLYVRNKAYAQTDMLCSIKLGCQHIPPCRAFFLLPGDMPFVSLETLHLLMEAKTENALAVFPLFKGRRKHPPLLDSRLLPRIIGFQAEGGLRELWHELGSQILDVPVEDEGVQIDLDTKEDYQHFKE